MNEVLIGATTLDSMAAISADEVTINAGHRIERMAAHILQQQSFAPFFPAPNNFSAQVCPYMMLLYACWAYYNNGVVILMVV